VKGLRRNSNRREQEGMMTLHKPKIVPLSHLFLIQNPSRLSDHHSYFLSAIQEIVDGIIPESLWINKAARSQELVETLFEDLTHMLPLFKCSPLNSSSTSLTVTYLTPAETTQKMRYNVLDLLSRLPGTEAEIKGGISYNFEFEQYPGVRFFIAQEILAIRNRDELEMVRKNLPELLEKLQRNLPYPLARQTDNIVHPIFMPRNEEEEIKYVRDIPQVSIHYDKQTDIGLSFTVIISRLLKKPSRPLHELIKNSSIKMNIEQVRVMGYLKQKHPKESAIIRVTLDKEPFFRADQSVDLLRARQKIVSELNLCLGDFRDFNGGMILKQDESLNLLRQEFELLPRDLEFILQNYFYSLRPAIMQTVYESQLLKKHFDLLSKAVKTDFTNKRYQMYTDRSDKFFICFIAAPDASFKERVLSATAKLKLNSRELTSCCLEFGSVSLLGFILKAETPQIESHFEATIRQGLR
jgi:hypothetical protein